DIEDMVSGFVKKQSEALAQKENKLPSDEKTLQSLDKAMQKIEERKRLKQEEELLQDNDLTDDEIRGIIGGDNARGVLDYLKKAEDYFDKQKEAEEYLEGINRRRVVSNANKIKSLEGSDVLKLEYFFEALNYEYLFADNWESFRETLAMGGIVDNYEAVRRFIEVGLDVPNDILELFKTADQYSSEVPDITSIVENKTQQVISGDQISKEAVEMGSDQGGISDFLAKQIASEDYVVKTVNIQDLVKGDKYIEEYLTNQKKVRKFKGFGFHMYPIVDSKGEVLDGYNRIHQRIQDGDTEITI